MAILPGHDRTGGKMNNVFRLTTALAASVALSGCAVMNSIHWKFPGPNGSSVFTVDAKQRHLIMAKEGKNGEKGIRVCAEAAPDVFSAINSSLGGNALFGATDRSAKISSAIAETAASIERTQTINLLRESMYRTCERYLSGALDKRTFVIQAARDQQTMLAILAIEQLTGAVRGPSVIISGPSTSAGIANGEELAKLITSLNTDYGSAKAAQANAANLLATADAKGKCVTNDKKPADVVDDDWAACSAAKATKAQRDTETKAAGDRLDKALAVGGAMSNGTDASTGTVAAQPGAAYTPNKDLIAAVAGSVERIALRPAINETLMFCIAYLGSEAALNLDTAKTCNNILASSATTEEQARRMAFSLPGLVANIPAITNDISQYSAFKKMMIDEIHSLSDQEAPKFVEEFERQAGIMSGGLTQAVCKSAETCIGYVNSDFYYSNFQAGFADAIHMARQTLNANRRNQ